LASAAAAQAPEGGSSLSGPTKGWWAAWFGGRAAAKDPAVQAVVEVPAVAAPEPAPTAAEEQQRQLRAFMRRMEVCDRMKQIALLQGDAELERQADLLLARAFEVYKQRVAGLSRPLPAAAWAASA
jgi:hypothetical protein